MSRTLLAKSLFEPLKTVESALETLSTVDSYVDVDVFELASEATGALAELGSTLHEAAPFPAMEATEASGDGSVGALLQSRYGTESDREGADVGSSDRVEVRDGREVIPLGVDGATRGNWAPAFRVLREFVEELLVRAGTVVRRVRTLEDLDARRVCRSVRRMLASVRDVLAWSVAGARFVGRRADNGADAPITFASWASDTLTGGNDA